MLTPLCKDINVAVEAPVPSRVMQPMLPLPPELHILFLRYLSIKDQLNVLITCKHAYQMVNYSLAERANEYGYPSKQAPSPMQTKEFLHFLFKNVKTFRNFELFENNEFNHKKINTKFKLCNELDFEEGLIGVAKTSLETLADIYASNNIHDIENIWAIHYHLNGNHTNKYNTLDNNTSLQPKLNNALFVAIEREHAAAVLYLLKNKASPNIKESDGKTPLILSIEKRIKSVTNFLLDFKADPNECYCQFSPLQLAMMLQDSDCVTSLLKYGASVHTGRVGGAPPLHLAAQTADVKSFETLLAHGADPHMKAANGSLPLHFAAQKGVIEIVDMLLELGVDINATGAKGITALRFSLDAQKDFIIEHLLKKGADPDIAGQDSITPLLHASMKGLDSAAWTLLEHGACANKPADDGRTPLYCAAENGNLNIVRILLEHGASINAQHRDLGLTARDIASKNGHFLTAAFLKLKEAAGSGMKQ